MSKQKVLNQYFTPTWVAEMCVAEHFKGLTSKDVVIDPSCGDGRFLMAIPEGVQAYGVEIDPEQACKAIQNSGRDVITGDFRLVDLPKRPTVVIGNPPFQADLVDDFLDRCHEAMEYGGRVGFILPVYLFQTANTVMRYARKWSLQHQLMPRNMFEGLKMPIMFAKFTKERKTVVSGLFLYAETASLADLRPEFKAMFVGNESRANVWRDSVQEAMNICGGRATLQQLYQCIERRRPTGTAFWREKIRQTAGLYFSRIGRAEYCVPNDFQHAQQCAGVQ